MVWSDLIPHLAAFWHLVCEDLEPRQRAGRLKQWLNLLRRCFAEAEVAYQHVRTMTDQRAITLWVSALQADGPADCSRAA
ncbi:tRNA-dihydrouridine(16) synthase [compost metagenome]